jgi:hypothetical protein
MPPRRAEGERLMRRTLTLLAAVAVLIGLVAAPAAADQPRTQELTYVDDDAWDPCAGEVMEETIHVVSAMHEHKNNIVETAKVTGFTSSGYELLSSPDIVVERADFVMTTYNKRWINTENGDRMHTSRVIVVKIDESGFDVKVWTPRAWCTSGPTIPRS